MQENYEVWEEASLAEKGPPERDQALKKCMEMRSEDGLPLEECESVNWVGSVKLEKAIVHVQLKLIKNVKALRRASADTLTGTSRQVLAWCKIKEPSSKGWSLLWPLLSRFVLSMRV